MKDLVSAKFFYIEDATAFLNVVLSINQRKEDFAALMVAERGDEYRRANYPKPYPDSIFLFIAPFISTSSSPSWRMKKELALSFCFMRYSPLLMRQSLNFSSRVSWMSLSLTREEKVKWRLKLLRMRVLSMTLFFFSITVKFS